MDPGQTAAVAWTLYARLHMSVPVRGTAFADMHSAHIYRLDAMLLGVLREMDRADLWRETPAAATARVSWNGPESGFWVK